MNLSQSIKRDNTNHSYTILNNATNFGSQSSFDSPLLNDNHYRKEIDENFNLESCYDLWWQNYSLVHQLKQKAIHNKNRYFALSSLDSDSQKSSICLTIPPVKSKLSSVTTRQGKIKIIFTYILKIFKLKLCYVYYIFRGGQTAAR